MALYLTNTVRIKTGHFQDYLAWAPQVIPIYQGYGVMFHGAFQAVGGEGNVAVYLVSVKDFEAWGKLHYALQADAAFQAAMQQGGKHIDGNVVQALVPLKGSRLE